MDQQQLDIVIVAVYFISVLYVFYQAFNSLDDQTAIGLDKDPFKQQLETVKLGEAPLKDLIDVKFKFEDRYKFSDTASEQPKELQITIENKSTDRSIYVDWDKSSLTDYEGRSRRVVRMTPDKRLDLSQRQAANVIAPGRSLKEKLTAEDLLRLKENNILEPENPLVDLGALKKAADNKKSSQKIKDIYADFMARKKPVKFSLRLALQFTESNLNIRTNDIRTDDIQDDDIRDDDIRDDDIQDDDIRDDDIRAKRFLYMIDCDFLVEKRPWTDYLPVPIKK